MHLAEFSWAIEEYHRGGGSNFDQVERCQVRSSRAPGNHIVPLRAFLCLECHCLATGISWFYAKTDIARQTVWTYLAKPIYWSLD